MSDTVIRVENVSKLYSLGEVGTGSLAHDVNRWWHRVRGKEDPYLKIGEVKRGELRTLGWSEKEISKKCLGATKVPDSVRSWHQLLGIIGRNGAGKSTLLKILSRVTTQSSGQIKVKVGLLRCSRLARGSIRN
jgi:lipopolysaccharide transport system ATP-binding protein